VAVNCCVEPLAIEALAGVTAIDTSAAAAVTAPAVPDMLTPSPVLEPAAVSLIAINALLTPAANERSKTATAPFEIVPAFMPETTQEYAPGTEKQLSVFEAFAAAAPALAEMETTSLAEYLRVHCKVAGWLPDGDVKFTVGGAPGAKVNESACPKAGNEAATNASAVIPTITLRWFLGTMFPGQLGASTTGQ
jgi:hypothetical protein